MSDGSFLHCLSPMPKLSTDETNLPPLKPPANTQTTLIYKHVHADKHVHRHMRTDTRTYTHKDMYVHEKDSHSPRRIVGTHATTSSKCTYQREDFEESEISVRRNSSMQKTTEALMDAPSTRDVFTEEKEEKSKNKALESVQSHKRSKPIAVHDQTFKSYTGTDEGAHEMRKPSPT